MLGVLRELFRRRVPQVAGIYLAAGWGLLEFSDWATARYGLGPAISGGVLITWLVLVLPVAWMAWRLGERTPSAPSREAPPRSVAVLPFTTMGADPDTELLGVGLSDQILTDLAKVGDLRVASRTSSFALGTAGLDVREVGRRLGVRAVLEGSVQRAGDRVRVTTQLVSAEDGYHLWSERYDRTVEDLFRIEDEIAEGVARVLKAILRDSERQALARAPTKEIGAYEAYLKGRGFYLQRRRRSLAYAREMFEQAIKMDPDFALAHAGLAETIALTAMYYPAATADLAAADAASRRAVALDPELAEAHVARGAVLIVRDELEGAKAAFRRAVALDPRSFEARYLHGRACFQAGDLEEAVRLFDEAGELVEDYQAAFFGAQARAALGGDALACQAYEAALGVAERHMLLNPDDPRAATMRAVSLCRLGRTAEGLEWGERAVRIDPDDAGVRYNVACLYALAGQRERALRCVEEAVSVGFGNRAWLEHDPDLESIRGDPRFTAILDRLPRPEPSRDETATVG